MKRAEKDMIQGISQNILYEDKAIIVCRKSAGIPTQTARPGEPDMESALKNYLKASYIGVVHRLDQPVEGVLVFAKTKEAAAGLSVQNAGQMMKKAYYAIALSTDGQDAAPETGREYHLTDYLLKNGRENISKVVGKGTPQAKRAELSYQVIQAIPAVSVENGSMAGDGLYMVLLKVVLKTGRHHQIRVQLSHAGLPLLGDGKYGSGESKEFGRSRGIKDVALCAYRLEFLHPVTGKKMVFEIEPSGAAFQPFFQSRCQ